MFASPQQDNQAQIETPKPSDKELNFRKQEEMFKRQIEQERQEKLQLKERLDRLEKERQQTSDADDDDADDEPYVDKKRLKKELGKVVKQTVNETDTRIQNAVQTALAQERQNQWLKNNPDFYEIMGHAQTFAERDPELAETILSMPEGFERQKLVYKNIKALGLHKKDEPKPSIQDKVDANRRSPYYQPSGVGTAPYAQLGMGSKNYSPTEMKSAYDKIKELQSRLRLG